MIYRGFRRQAQHSASSRDRRHPLRRLVCCRPFRTASRWWRGCPGATKYARIRGGLDQDADMRRTSELAVVARLRWPIEAAWARTHGVIGGAASDFSGA